MSYIVFPAAFRKKNFTVSTCQLRKAAISIGANLAEGCGRRTNAEMARFIAMGSSSELDHHLLLCKDLGFMQDHKYKQIVGDLNGIRRMLSGLLDSVEGDLGLSRAAAKG